MRSTIEVMQNSSAPQIDMGGNVAADQKNTFSFLDNLVDSSNNETPGPSHWGDIDRIDIEYLPSPICRIMETQRERSRVVPESNTRQSKFIVSTYSHASNRRAQSRRAKKASGAKAKSPPAENSRFAEDRSQS